MTGVQTCALPISYRYNKIENVYDALVLDQAAGYSSGKITFNNNIVRNVANLAQIGDEMTGEAYVFSNTFVNYAIMGARVRSANTALRYYFYNNLMVRAGCRYFSIADAREHWAKTRGDTVLGDESQALVSHLEAMARIAGWTQ